LGGYTTRKSADVWRPDGSTTCSLPSLPENMTFPSVDLVGGNITACYASKCWLLAKSGWEAGPDTLQSRRVHTSAVLPGEGLLLVGGQGSSTTTEIIRPGHKTTSAFTLTPGRWQHCSVQTSNTLLISGGWGPFTLVQEYSGIDSDSVSSKDLPSLNQGRRAHACGVYYVGATKVSSPPPPSTQGQHRWPLWPEESISGTWTPPRP
jgi:hypothetical protein